MNGRALLVGLALVAGSLAFASTPPQQQAQPAPQTAPTDTYSLHPRELSSLRELVDPGEICAKMPVAADQTSCRNTLQSYDHFDAGAADVCLSFSFTQDRMACLRNIGGKVYDDRVLEMCRRESMTSNRLQCLAQTGRPFDQVIFDPTCLPLSEVQRDLETAIKRMDSGENSRARAILTNLLRQARICQ